MNRLAIRGVIGVVALCVFFAVRYANRSSSGTEHLKQAHRLVAKIDGYAANKDYMDWLVDSAHDEVFNEAYHMDTSRHSDRSWVDEGKYITDLFATMIRTAETDQALAVAAALKKYQTEHLNGRGR